MFVLSEQDSSQIELLKELLDLQQDMIVMMLSLLEGSQLYSIRTQTFNSLSIEFLHLGFFFIIFVSS